MIVNGTTASANVTVDENSTEGDALFNITVFDLAGNSKPDKSNLFKTVTQNQTNQYSNNHNTSSSNLHNSDDKNIPIVSNLNVQQQSNSSLAKAGDLINITLEVSENIYNATLEILNTTINMTESNNTAYANISVLQNFQTDL